MKRFVLSLPAVILVFVPLLLRAEVVDRIVAIVNDEVITLGEVEKYVMIEKKSRYSSVNEYVRNTQLKERLDGFIENLLLGQQGKKLKLEVEDKDVNFAVEGLLKQNGITKAQLNEQLKTEKIAYKDFEDGVKKSLIRTRVLSRVLPQEMDITEKTLRDYYNAHASEYSFEEFRLQQVFISGKRQDAVERARAAFDMLQRDRSFEEVARLYSDQPEKTEDTGYTKKDDLMPELRDAMKLLVPGTYSTPVQTQYGFHIVKLLEDRKGALVTFEEVKDKIKQKVYEMESEKRYKDYINKLKNAAYIEVKI